MPAKGTKSIKTTKPKTVKVKSNTVKASSKTGLLSKRIKFNWKIAAVIGLILVAALGYLFVRLSYAGGADLSALELAPDGDATRVQKANGSQTIAGPGIAWRRMNQNDKAYPKNWDIKTIYTVSFLSTGQSSTNNAGLYLACQVTNKQINVSSSANGLSPGGNLSVRASQNDVARICGNAEDIKLTVGIPGQYYITGVSVSHPAATPTTPSPAPGAKNTTSPAPSPQLSCATMVNGQGNQNACVTLIQQRLKDLGYDPGPVDGIYGSKTAAAVKVFQQRSGLTQDGVVGPQTWNALTSPNAARKQ